MQFHWLLVKSVTYSTTCDDVVNTWLWSNRRTGQKVKAKQCIISPTHIILDFPCGQTKYLVTNIFVEYTAAPSLRAKSLPVQIFPGATSQFPSALGPEMLGNVTPSGFEIWSFPLFRPWHALEISSTPLGWFFGMFFDTAKRWVNFPGVALTRARVCRQITNTRAPQSLIHAWISQDGPV